MAFPTDLTNAVDNTTAAVAAQLNNIEAKIGIDSSAVATSIDYLLKSVSSTDPGHKHPQAKITGLTTTDGPTFAHLHISDLAAITTAAESWVGPSSTTGVYFKGDNVGIGTTSPTALLQLSRVAVPYQNTPIFNVVPEATWGIKLQQYHTGSGYDYYLMQNNGSATDVNLLTFKSGNVGIGTTAPLTKLDVRGASAAPGSGGTASGGILTIYGSDTTESLAIGTLTAAPYSSWIQTHDPGTGTYPLSLNPLGGNVGIGTTNPISKLDVVTSSYSYAASPLKGTGMNLVGAAGSGVGGGDGAASGVLNVLDNAGMGINNGGTITLGGNYIASGNAYSLTYAGIKGGKENATDYDSAGYLGLFTTPAGATPTEKVRITSTGNVGIGTAAPASLLEVQGGLTTTGAVLTLGSKETSTVWNDVLGRINFYAPLDASGSDAILVAGSIVARAEGTFSAASNATSLDFQTGSSEVATTKMTIMSSGNVGIGTVVADRLCHIRVADAATNSSAIPLRLSHITSGTSAAGFATGIEFENENSDGLTAITGTINSGFAVVGASLAGYIELICASHDDSRNLLRVELHHSAGRIGFLGVTPVVQAAHIANPTDLATCQTSIASILTALENYGLLATS